jgi:hypothetical protein
MQNAKGNEETDYQPNRSTRYSALEKGNLKSPNAKAESG